ncbi:hypothetical protein F4803DRAFT_535910 [Xylaria telfairii]|nr:hypothetical protein F4803DRAFT_535910 [Xylaria telfairii]
MSPPASVPQAALASAILFSTVGTYMALSPPHPNRSTSLFGDPFSRLKLTSKHVAKVAMAPIALLALHTASLAYFSPDIPPSILGYGGMNGVSKSRVTWSPTTAVPLALIFCVGIPLRLGSYAALGGNFTFALAEPNRLVTTGIYRYMRHPSYTGLLILILCNMNLVGRVDGALSCWIRPVLFPYFLLVERVLRPVGVIALVVIVLLRVKQEEDMLHARFGVEWQEWRTRTRRFIPCII